MGPARAPRSRKLAAKNFDISPSLTTADAFRSIGTACLGQLHQNEGAMLTGDREALHQMRIAMRRLRAALAVFSAVVSDRSFHRIKAELRWLSSSLGPARDLDVFLTEVLVPFRHQHSKAPGAVAIYSDFLDRRRTAYEDAAAAVRSRRFHSLVDDTRVWIESGPWTTLHDESRRIGRERPIATHAAAELARLRRKLKRSRRAVRKLSVVERHRLRIRAKKLRYAAEFFANVFPGRKASKRARAALSALKELQDAVGALNDIATHEALAAHVVSALRGARKPAAEPAAEALAAAVIFVEQEGRVAELLDAADRAYARYLQVKPFWK